MQFEASVLMTKGATDPDPVTTPATVPDDRVLRFPYSFGPRGLAKRLLLALECVSGTVTLDVYTMDDSTFELAKASRKYYKFAAAQTITKGVLSEITAAVPPAGVVYFRITGDTMGADGSLKVSFAE
jgi:hypothetical protein